MSTLADTIRKVEGLLNQADHANTGPAEAETFRKKAEALMFKYRIDESMLTDEERTAQAIAVEWMDLDVCDMHSDFHGYYRQLVRMVLGHLDIRGMSDYVRSEETGSQRLIYRIVGYESDLLFATSLFAGIRLAFSGRLEPKYDSSETAAENCYRMRSAGMEGVRIAWAVFGDGKKSNCAKARKLARQHAESIGDDAKAISGHGMKIFRESYAQGFVETIGSRLTSMRMARGAVENGMVLAGRKEAINEAFYERFPYMKPMPSDQIMEAAPPCPKCAKAQSGYCRDHPKPRKGRVRYANMTALNRGQSAARTVDLGVTGREVE